MAAGNNRVTQQIHLWFADASFCS